MNHRACEECGAALHGRSDKKFCSDQCRSTSNNRRNKETNHYVREINNVLSKNRRILDSLNPGGRVKIPASRLSELGFDFRYYTSTSQVREGGVCYFCYDQGYIPVQKAYCVLVTRESEFQACKTIGIK